jgi:probable F420-dependent oxidoreductase
MDSGIGYFPTHDAVDPADMARLVEERGHGALYFAEHTHIPVSRDTPYPSGGELPRKYSHTHDLFVALTAAALATRRLRVGSGVCLVIERDPIVTAKEVASVDVLSGGRLDFGIGAGWNREEMVNHGTDPRTRMRLLRERVEAMQAIWSQDAASYHGDFVDFDPIWSWPKPLQRPWPPVLVGGGGPTVFDRVLGYGDAWFAQHRSDPLSRLGDLRTRADEAGRDVPVDVIGVPPDPHVLERYAEAGIRRVSMWAPSAGRGTIERALDAFERALAEVRGEA